MNCINKEKWLGLKQIKKVQKINFKCLTNVWKCWVQNAENVINPMTPKFAHYSALRGTFFGCTKIWSILLNIFILSLVFWKMQSVTSQHDKIIKYQFPASCCCFVSLYEKFAYNYIKKYAKTCLVIQLSNITRLRNQILKRTT